MAYIYQITNDVNGKIYIGKTEFSIQKRFQEHCRDSQKQTEEHRPLYAAMRKYGTEHFHIELIEETDNPEERERYWIEMKGSFKNGYNATLGGDGKRYIDYDLVIETYQHLKSEIKTAKQLGIDESSVRRILKSRSVTTFSSSEVNKANGMIVNQYSLDGTYIRSYSTVGEAAKDVRPDSTSPGVKSHITDVCKGKRKTAYGYRWSYGSLA